MLVPLTNSLYVPGSIANVESLLVDLGTGYFIEKSQEQTQQFLGRRISMVSTKLAELEVAVSAKRRDVEQVMSVLAQKAKIMQAQARQQPAMPQLAE
jgi:prefoldin alpha subunit